MHEELTKVVGEVAVNGKLSCADAHLVADQLGVSPLEVGKAVNRATDLRFYRCQLGLFGYGPKPEGKHKIVLKAERVPEEIGEAIKAKAQNGRISCQAVWEIAEQFKYPRLGIADIIETMELQVTPCQLACF